MATISDPATLKALAHPVRWRILHHLDTEGPATSTTLARVLGENTGTTSYHLRQLARYGFIEECVGHSPGRERWWQRASDAPRRGVAIPPVGELSSEERAVVAEFDDVVFAEDLELARRFVRDHRQVGDWAQVIRATRYMTVEQLVRFREAYERLLDEHCRQSAEAGAESRPVALRFFALPAQEEAPDIPESRG